jgi:hypothetical protein
MEKLKSGPKPKYTPEERAIRTREINLAYYYRNREKRKAINLEFARRRSNAAPWTVLVHCARTRAKKAGLPFDIDYPWAEARWDGRCEITGLEFRPNRGHGCGPAPFSPSIDRIIPALGYTKGNCRFILHALNALKGAGTDEDAIAIAKAFVEFNQRDRS